MIRGLFSGLVWGGVFSAVLAVLWTQVGGRVNVVRAAVPPVTVDPGSDAAPDVAAVAATQGDGLGAAPAVGDAARPAGTSDADAPMAGDSDVARPTPGNVQAEVRALEESSPGSTPAGDAPAVVPETPSDPQVSAALDTPPTRVPEAPAATTAEQDAPDQPDAAPSLTEAAELPDTADPVGQPDVPDTPELAALVPETTPDATTPEAPDVDASGAVGADPGALDDGLPQLNNQPDSLPGAAVAPAAPSAPGATETDIFRPILPVAPEPPVLGAPTDEVQDPNVDAAPADQPTLPGAEVADLPSVGAVDGVVENRLPRIGDPEPSAEADVAAEAEVELADAGEETADGAEEQEVDAFADGAISQFAAPYEPIEGQPVLAVVLIDDGGPSGDLGLLPPNVTIAVPIGLPDAAERISAIRAAGHEVVMIPNVQGGATRQDVANAMAQALTSAPEAVAVMDMPDQTFQRDRFVMNEVLIAAASTGHGVIVHPGGLNTAMRLADQQSLPAGFVEGDIDGFSEEPGDIGRALDQAEFEARQQGGAIVIGRTGANTIDSVAAWAARLSDEGVGLAPVSVILRAGQGG